MTTRSFMLSVRQFRRGGTRYRAAISRRLAVIAILLANLLALSFTPVAAATPTIVTTNALNGWETVIGGTATFAFETGPDIPPLGNGSVKLSVGSDGNGAQVRYLNASGTRLADITTLSYSTFIANESSPGMTPDQAPYLVLQVDNNGDDIADDRLYFEPTYQQPGYEVAPDNGPIPTLAPVAVGVWQNWDALHGGWWLNSGSGGPPLYTIAGYLALHPDARIINDAGPPGRRGLYIVAGFGAPDWDNFVGNVDNVKIVAGALDRTFDFEPGTNLAITKSASAGTVDAGAELTYTLKVENKGPGDARDVIVADTLPAGTTFVSCTADQSGACGGTGNSRQVTFATLPASATATITITVAVDEDWADGAVLANTATVTSAAPDSDTADDSSTANVTVSNPCVSPFDDVPSDDETCVAIVAMAEAGIIQGYDTDPPTFGPDDPVQRAQLTSFVVRALEWEDRPTGPRTFTDLGGLLGDLATSPLIAANACTDPADEATCVAQGYAAADCVAKGKTAPCFGPTDRVSYAQVISFIARAFAIDPAFAWQAQTCGSSPPYSGLPADHAADICTFDQYAGTIPDAPTTTGGWDSPASREWAALIIYQALQSAP